MGPRFWPIFLAILGLAQAHRLNVPSVLLPYHPINQVSFVLKVSEPDGACFTWKSSRPDIASITPIEPRENGCSTRALLTSKSRHADEQRATVFATEISSGTRISCGVSIDVIHSIKVDTITNLLFLEPIPARITVTAYNNQGHAFSSLGGIPFDWNLKFSDSSRRPLKIIPFSQSTYQAPVEIEKLEEQKKKGSVILVGGIQTGAAELTAKFSEAELSHITPNSIELFVVANLQLIPSEDLYLPVNAIVSYKAVVLKNGVTEAVDKDQYLLTSSSADICGLEPSTNVLTAKSLGEVEVSLMDTNIALKSGFKPISAHVYVVEVDSIHFVINRGNKWALQTGVDYTIEVKLLDSDQNNILITENLFFETNIPEHFKVLEKSKNGTYFHVQPLKTGEVLLQSSFFETSDSYGYKSPVSVPVTGQQKAVIYEPLNVEPKTLVFPYQLHKPYEYQIRVSGGSGVFQYHSENSRFATVSENGAVRSGQIGETIVHVNDHQNDEHRDLSKVIVTEPNDLEFGDSALEAEIGKTLTINLKLFTKVGNAPVPFTDCRNLDFEVAISNPNVFQVKKDVKAQIPKDNAGCTTITLFSLADGDSRLTVKFGELTTSVDIYAYPPLELLINEELLLAVGSSTPVLFRGGPRPFALDRNKYFSTVKAQNEDIVHIEKAEKTFLVHCSSRQAETEVTVKVGNKKSSALPKPAQAQASIKLCCAVPKRLVLSAINEKRDEKIPACPSVEVFAHSAKQFDIDLSAYGYCPSQNEDAVEKKFASVTSLIVDFHVHKSELASISRDNSNKQSDHIVANIKPNGKSGQIEVIATAKKYNLFHSRPAQTNYLPSDLTATLNVELVDLITPATNEVVLWNQQDALVYVPILHGSGYFYIDHSASDDVINSELRRDHTGISKSAVSLTPVKEGITKLTVYDLCVAGKPAEVSTKVTEISQINIITNTVVEVRGEIPLSIEILDIEGQTFSLKDIQEISLNLEYNNELIEISKEALLNYNIKGLKIGTTSITVSALSATGRTVKSDPHHLQIYAPLSLDPLEVTLLPESFFQLEIFGGPRPVQPVNFHLNHSSVASISETGLIRSSKTLGLTSIKGNVGSSESTFSAKEVILKVVSLEGVRIFASSSFVQSGELVDLRVEGLAGPEESPFSFGGAVYPLNVEWSVHKADEQIVNFNPVLSELATEPELNRFGTQLKAGISGIAEIQVRVTPHANSYHHFQSRSSYFEDTIKITVVDPLSFVTPSVQSSSSIRITPNTDLLLNVNRPNEQITYKVLSESRDLASVSNVEGVDGSRFSTLISSSNEGVGSLFVEHSDQVYRDSFYQTVEVVPAQSIHLVVEESQPKKRTSLLPGTKITVNIEFRDVKGRVLHAANNKLNIRPHRFDFTEIVISEDRRSFKVYLKYNGETVIRVWDPKDPKLSTFIRLPVAELSPEEIKDEQDEQSQNITLLPTYTDVRETVDHARSGVVHMLADFFDRYIGLTLFLMLSFVVGTVVSFWFYIANRQNNQYRPPNKKDSSFYAYSNGADGSFGIGNSFSASPLFHSTPTEIPKPKPTQSAVFPSPQVRATIQQRTPNLNNRSAGSSQDDLFNASISPNNKLNQITNRYYK